MKRIIISYDGNFFLNRVADLVSDTVEITLIQNFVPGRLTGWIIRLYDFLFSKKSYENKLARKVRSKSVKSHSVTINDIFRRLLQVLNVSNDVRETLGALSFGFLSRLWIKSEDVFHVRSGYGQGGAIKLARKRKMRIIVDHSIAHNKEMDSILRPEYLRHGLNVAMGSETHFWNIVEKDCNSADVLLVNSDYVKETFIAHGYPADKIRVIYLGVREDWLEKKANYELKDGVLKLLFVGGFGIRKGAEYILRALPLLEEKNVKFRIDVIGGNQELKNIISKYDKKKRINFLGMVPYDRLINYYIAADAFLFPSLCEGGTRAGMEAMGVGLPVIMTENCGCPVVNEGNGLIVPIKDERAIANAVEKLYSSISLREKLGKNASDLIKKEYTWERYKYNLISLYNDC